MLSSGKLSSRFPLSSQLFSVQFPFEMSGQTSKVFHLHVTSRRPLAFGDNGIPSFYTSIVSKDVTCKPWSLLKGQKADDFIVDYVWKNSVLNFGHEVSTSKGSVISGLAEAGNEVFYRTKGLIDTNWILASPMGARELLKALPTVGKSNGKRIGLVGTIGNRWRVYAHPCAEQEDTMLLLGYYRRLTSEPKFDLMNGFVAAIKSVERRSFSGDLVFVNPFSFLKVRLVP